MRRLWPDPADIDDVAALVAADARPTPDGRPWLLVNMVTSLDGAVTIEGRSGGLARPADKEMFFALRAVADVIFAGAGTVRTEGYGPPRPSAADRAARRERGQSEVPRLAIVSRSLTFDLQASLFTEAVERPLVLTSQSADAARRKRLEEVAEVIVAGDVTVDLPMALAEMRSRGVQTVTCEGGPHLNADLALADLIDEWALTLSPLLVGGDAPRSSAGQPAPAPIEMRLDRLVEGDGLLLTRWVRAR